MGNQRHYSLVLIPPPFQGHINPMLQLGTILHSKGFSITVAHTHFNSVDPSNHPNFTFLPFSDGICDSHLNTNNLMDVVSAINNNSGTPLKELLVDQMAKANEKNEKIACIIYDACLHFIDSVAKELELPTAVLRITNATNLLTHHVFPKLQSKGSLPLQDYSRSWDLVPELDPLRFRDLPIFKLPNLEAYLRHTADAIAVKPSLGVICNTVDCLEGPSLNQLQQLYKVSFYPIGPLHIISEDSSTTSLLTEDYTCITWLNNQETSSVLYVSPGSIASWDEKELTEMAFGSANSGQHFLWVIRPGNVDDVSEWLQSLPEDVKVAIAERGCIVKWAPQRDVLAHRAVGGFWSHCGWNSTLESLFEGVPMICQPCFADQRVNARLVSHVWRVGVEWSNVMERGEIEGAVRRLMVSPEGTEMLQRAVELKDEIKVAASGGSSIDALNELVNSILSVNNAIHVSPKTTSLSVPQFKFCQLDGHEYVLSF